MAINIYDKREAAKFTPLSMQEVLLPAQVQSDREDKMTMEYGEMSSELSKLEHLMEAEPDDSQIKERFFQYKNTVKKTSDSLYDNGVDTQSLRRLMEMKSEFSGVSTSIVEAGKLKSAEITTAVQAAMQNPDLVVEDITQRSIQDYIDSGYSPLGFKQVSSSQIGEQFGKLASILTKFDGDPSLSEAYRVQLRALGFDSDLTNNFLLQVNQLKGLTPQEIANHPYLEQMKQAVLRANGVIDNQGNKSSWVSNEGMFRIENQMETQKWNAVGGESVNLMGDPTSGFIPSNLAANNRRNNSSGSNTIPGEDKIYLHRKDQEYTLAQGNDVEINQDGSLNTAGKNKIEKFDISYTKTQQFTEDLDKLTQLYIDDTWGDTESEKEFLENLDPRTQGVIGITDLVNRHKVFLDKKNFDTGYFANIKRVKDKIQKFEADLPGYSGQLQNISDISDALGLSTQLGEEGQTKATNEYIEQTKLNKNDLEVIFPVWNYNTEDSKKILSGVDASTAIEIDPKTGMPISKAGEEGQIFDLGMKNKDGYSHVLRYSALLGPMIDITKDGQPDKTKSFITSGTFMQEMNEVRAVMGALGSKEMSRAENVLKDSKDIQMKTETYNDGEKNVEVLKMDIVGPKETSEVTIPGVDGAMDLQNLIHRMMVGGNNISNYERAMFGKAVLSAMQKSGMNVLDYTIKGQGETNIIEVGIPLKGEFTDGRNSFIKIVGLHKKGSTAEIMDVTTILPLDENTSLQGSLSLGKNWTESKAKSYVLGTKNKAAKDVVVNNEEE